jgi:hypothetical protein
MPVSPIFRGLDDCIRDPQVLQSVASGHEGAFASPRNAGVKGHAERGRRSQPTSADDSCIGSEVSLIGLFERHGKFFDCGPGVRTEATPPHKRLRRLLDQHTDSVRKPLHAGVPRQLEEWRKTLSV